MATTKAVAGSTQKNNGSTILNGGTTSNPANNILTFAQNTVTPKPKGVVQAVSALESGNLGTLKAVSGGNFSHQTAGEYTGMIIGTKIAGVTNNVLKSPASDKGSRKALHYGRGNNRYDVTTYNYFTGAATKGGNAGVAFTYWDPVAGTAIAVEPKPTSSIPGELTYMVNGVTPTQDDYKAKNTF